MTTTTTVDARGAPPATVVDVSVHCAACRSRSPTSPNREIVHRAAHGHHRLAFNDALLTELGETLTLRLGFPEDDAVAYVALVIRIGQRFGNVPPTPDVWCVDSDDVYLLLLANISAAWRLVTRDAQHLLDATKHRGCLVPVRKPGQFLGELRVLRGEPPDSWVSSGATFPPRP